MPDLTYEQIIVNTPQDLDRAIIRVLGFHEGVDRAIGRKALVEEVSSMGFQVHERQVRETIKHLRRNGWMICAIAGTDGGYYLASSRVEYEDFRQREFIAKIADMAETVKAMDKAASGRFGDYAQGGLF